MYKDFRQKNRHRPVKITDVAIEKVPEVSLSGFTKEESQYIQEQHKFLLKVAKEDNNSGEDFKTFCNNKSLYIITVVGNDGSVRALTKEKDFDANKALEYYFELAIKKYINCKNNGELAMRELLKNSNKIGLSYKIGGKNHG